MTDKTNVITVSSEDLAWINANVPGKSKRERLVNILRAYQEQRTTATATTTKGASA
jgi:hypothetical protein